MSVPYISAGPTWFMKPSTSAALFILETNASRLAVSDNEAFAVSFAPVETDMPGRLAISPLIGQTSGRTIAADSSYFYRDFEEIVV